MYENEPVNSYVKSVNFNGFMTAYTIIEDSECAGGFQINPFTGVISTKVIKTSRYNRTTFRFKTLRLKPQNAMQHETASTARLENSLQCFPFHL